MQANKLKKRSLYFLIFTDALFNIATLVLVPIFAVYTLSLGGDVRHIGELYAIYAISFGIVGWLTSTNFLHKRRNLMAAYLIWSIYAFVLIFNDSLTTFYCLQVLSGAAAAIRYPFLQLSISDHSVNSERASFTKVVYEFFGRLTGAIIALLAAHYAHHKGFQGVFIFMTCLSVFAMIISIFYAKHIKCCENTT